ncbi:hypothetical protein Tco_0984138, partial [Tanacetum coccineum]
AKPKADKVVIQQPKIRTTTNATTIIAASTRPKAKGLVIHEQEQAPTPTPIVSSQQPSQVKVQDKGKGIMVKEPLKMKKKDQVSFDEQEAKRLQAEFDEEERLAREKDEANIALTKEWNDIQDKIETDYELAQRLQAEEQEELTIDKKATLFQQLLEKRRKHFAAKRAEEKRNRPPTKAQQRSIITELVEGTEKREGLEKRAGTELEKEVAKKQKVDVEKETEQETTNLKSLMGIVFDEEGVAIDDIPLATKPPRIVDWKILIEEKKSYYQFIRACGQSKRPEEVYERVLWGDLKTMFEPNVEDEGRIVAIKRLFDDLRVTAAKVCVTAAKQNLVLFKAWLKALNKEETAFTHKVCLLQRHGSRPAHMVAASKVPILKPGIPNEHQMKFNSIKDAKSLLQAVEKRVGDSRESISQEAVNQKFLRSLSTKNGTKTTYHTFVSANNNINEVVNTAHGATTASTQATAINSTTIDNLSDAVICLESVEARLLVYKKNESVYEKNIKVLKRKIHLREVAIIEAEKGKEFVNEPIVSKSTVKKPIVENSEDKASKAKPKAVRKNNGAPIIEDWVSDSEEEVELGKD